jgi:riboflavin synthase
MFTGIIETTGKVLRLEKGKENITFSIASDFLQELKIDQSLAHNGVCLTVDGIKDDHYTVTAIAETLQRTNLGQLQPGDSVNLERCMKLGDRLDGHIVQGHVDTTGKVDRIVTHGGSWEYFISYNDPKHVTVEKGSITVNGVSLTVVHSSAGKFSVAIIPYTFEHTTFQFLREGDTVNLEFDIVGKYIARLLSSQQS